MARRRAEEDEGSLDSLLDTMTNVVGILVILMIVTQLGVADAVKRILRAGETPAMVISPEALDQAKDHRDELEKTLLELREKWKDLETRKPEDVAAIEDVTKLTEQLKKELAAAQEAKVDAEKLKKELEAREKKADELKKVMDELEKELAKLRAQMETKPEVDLPPVKVVTLPNPRQAPEGAKPVTMLVMDGRVTPADDDALRQGGDTAMKRLHIEPNEEGLIDCEKLVGAFDEARLGDRNWIIRLKIYNFRPYIVPERRENGGETIDQLEKLSSTYMRTVRLTKQQGNYLRFIVASDSYDAYLEARRLADIADVPAGWTAVSPNWQWRIWIHGKVNCIGKPEPKPKPDTPTKPKPEKPEKPPLPKEEID